MADGLKVAVFGTDPQTRNRYIVLAVADALRRHSSIARVSLPTYADVARHCADEQIDLLLAIGGGGAIVEPLERAIKHARTAALWVTEDPYELQRNVELAHLFDIVATNDANAKQRYPVDVLHLPLAASTLFHDCPVASKPTDFLFDLFFVGTAWPDRVDTLNALLAMLPRSLRKKIGLSGNPFLPDFHLGDLDLITDFRLPPREFARMANRSVVALTLDRGFSAGPAPDIAGSTPPPRVFEHALAGAAQVYLTERPDIAAYFNAGEEILVAQTVSEAAAAIRRLVEDPDARRRIAEAARRRTLAEHLYEHRVAELVAAVKRNGPHPRPVHATTARKRVLLVSHNIVGSQPFGGVELYQETLAQVLSHHDFHVLYPDRHTGKLTLRNLGTGETESFAAGPIDHTVTSDRLREKAFFEVLFRHRIDLVHYHHLLGHPLGLPLLSYAAGVPGVFHVHDYFGICPEFNLIGQNGQYCRIRDDRTDVCDACLGTRGLARPGAQARRRWVMSQMLDRMDAIVHSVEYTRRKFMEIYPDLPANKHHVIGNSARADTLRELGALRGGADDSGRESTRRLQVAVLGNFTQPKGAELLIGIFQRLAHAPIDIHILGRVDDKFARIQDQREFGNVSVHGEYELRQLPDKLRGKDVSLHFSIWPETYCLGVDEARAAGLVPIVLGYGALAERVRDGIDGFVVDANHPFDLIGILYRLVNDRSVLAGMRYGLDRLLSDHDRHFARLDDLYNRLCSRQPAHQTSIPAGKGRTLLLEDLNIRFNNGNWSSPTAAYDDNPLRGNSIAVGIEQRQPLTPPELLTGRDTVATAPAMADADHGISIVLGEVLQSISRPRVLRLPPVKRTLAMAVGVPVRSRSRPFEVVVVGSKQYRIPLQDSTIRATDLVWSTAHIDLSVIEADVYGVVVTLHAGVRLVRYLSGVRIVLTDGPLPTPPTTESRGPSVETKARPHGSLPTLRQSSRILAIRTRRTLQSGLDVLVAVSKFARRPRLTLRAPNVIAHVDAINGSRPSTSHPTNVNRKQGLTVRGWAVPRDRDASFDTIAIRLAGKSDMRSESLPPIERPDVAAHFSNDALLHSGIECSLTTENLEPGIYELEIIAFNRNARPESVVAGLIEIE
ncbi:glycosyltransferase family protein [Vineibacter terrae]|nr:glycosyltransferase [Vineibacter terrae]